MTLPEFVSVLSDAAVGVAAIAAAVVAWRGLSTWRDQLKGTVEYELARRVLKGTYRLRDAIAGVRESFMSISEMPDPPKEAAEKMDRDTVRYHGVSRAYQARWDRVTSAHTELDPELMEAEVLWGPDVKIRLQTALKLEHELFVAVRHHVALLDPKVDGKRKEVIERITSKRRDVMFSNLDESPDLFTDEFAAAVREIEDYLRPHLRRN